MARDAVGCGAVTRALGRAQENQTIVPYMVDPDAAQSVAIWADNSGNGLDYTIPVVGRFFSRRAHR